MAATRPISTAAIEKGTGRSWEGWLEWLEGIGAQRLTHKEIAARIVEEGLASGWWAQSVTIAYEQHAGRRVPGQDGKGAFQLSVTKTFAGTMDEAIGAWAKRVEGKAAFDGVAVAKGPRTSATPKWRRWGVTLADGSRVTASASQKAPGKAGLTVAHEGLASPEAAERWRAYWKGLIST